MQSANSHLPRPRGTLDQSRSQILNAGQHNHLGTQRSLQPLWTRVGSCDCGRGEQSAYSRGPTLSPRCDPGWKTNVLPFLFLPGAGRGRWRGGMNKASIMLAGSLVLPMARASSPNGEAEAQRCYVACPRSHRFRGGTLWSDFKAHQPRQMLCSLSPAHESGGSSIQAPACHLLAVSCTADAQLRGLGSGQSAVPLCHSDRSAPF